MNNVTTVASGTGVILVTTPTAGRNQKVFNRGANALMVYPACGAQLEAYGANIAVTIIVGGVATFTADTTTLWLVS